MNIIVINTIFPERAPLTYNNLLSFLSISLITCKAIEQTNPRRLGYKRRQNKMRRPDKTRRQIDIGGDGKTMKEATIDSYQRGLCQMLNVDYTAL